jgi:hypothetical protein
MVLPAKRQPECGVLVLTREECLQRFMQAVRDGRRGDYNSAKAIVESVKQRSGNEAAETAKRELWAFIRSDKNAK